MKSVFRFKLLLIMITSILVPVIFLTLFITFNSDLYNSRYIVKAQKSNVEKDILQFEQFFVTSETNLSLYAPILGLTDDKDFIIQTLNQFVDLNIEFYGHSFYTDINGNDYIDHNIETNVDGEDRPWFEEAKKNNGFAITKPYQDVITEKTVITLSMPVKRNDRFYGVFGVDCYLDTIIEDIAQITNLEEAVYVLKDEEDNILKLYNIENEEKLNDLLVLVERKEGYSLSHYDLNQINTKIDIIYANDAYSDSIRNVRLEMTLLFIFVILVSVVFAFSIAKRISDPLLNFVNRIKNRDVQINQDDFIISGDWDEEFEILFEEFEKLSRQIRIEEIKLNNRIKELQEKNDVLMDKNIDLEEVYKNLKQIDKKVRKSRKEYESILENIKGMIWVLDGQGKIIFVNTTLCRTLGYESMDLIGESYSKIIQNFYAEKFMILDLLSKRDYKKIDINLLNSKNQIENVEANTSRVFSDSGDLLYIYGICRASKNIKALHYNYNVKIQEQNLIMDLTETASMNVSMNQVTKAIFDKINSIFGWSAGTIRFLNDNNEFELIARTEVGSDYIVGQSLSYENNCLTYVVESNEILYVSKVDELPIKEEIYSQILEDGYSIIFIPVGNNDIGRGVISLTIDRVSMVEKEDMLKSFTNTILIVVERALIYEKLKKDYIRMIKVLAEAGDDKDSSSVGHSNRVARYAKQIGERLYLDDDEIIELEICGLLHDIGKIGISDEYLSNPSPIAIEKVKNHPSIGRKMLEDIGLNEHILDGIEMHHMNFDLSGYPVLDTIHALPLFPRIIQIADEFDNYRVSGTFDSDHLIFNKMLEDSGKKYDPQILRVFKEIIDCGIMD
ncbi:MAG: HD domain-containing protein [Clostridia bacterium]|nr:HD domain-containing protein [Clostridia bacterium]